MLGAVVAGGVVGVALRELLLLPFATDADISATALVLPVATLGVNVLGSFLLGIVVGSLGDRHPLARAFVGTGVLGGFTTYSAFAVQSASLIGSAALVGLALALTAVFAGLLAAVLGVRVTRRGRGSASGATVGPEASG
jgi:CrcB protein